MSLCLSSTYTVLVTTGGEPSSLISTILPWPSFFEWNNMSQSSGPSLMRHYEGQISGCGVPRVEGNVQ